MLIPPAGACRYEQAQTDEGLVRRPVVRLPGGVVLTRIDPARQDTSMIMRIRPGWDALRSLLAPKPAVAPGQSRYPLHTLGSAPLFRPSPLHLHSPRCLQNQPCPHAESKIGLKSRSESFVVPQHCPQYGPYVCNTRLSCGCCW